MVPVMQKTANASDPSDWTAPASAPPARGGASTRARRLFRVALAIVIALSIIGMLAHTSMEETASVPLNVIAPPPAVVGLGYLEPETTVVRIGAAGSVNGAGAKVGALRVAEGDDVQAGQELALLDTAPRLAAQVAASALQVRLKRLQYEQQRLDLANSIAARSAALERAQAELVMTRTEYGRQSLLVGGNVVSRSSFDRAARDYLNDRATVAEMQAALQRLQASVAESGDEQRLQIDLAVTQAAIAAAEADLAVSRASLAEATIKAPFDGRVLALKCRAGEQIGTDGLLEMGDVSRMRAVVEVYQTDIARVRVGEPVRLRAEALPSAIEGRVERVRAAVQRQTVVNNDPAAATDARVVQVFVALDAANSAAIAGLSRLQVQAVFGR